MAALHSYARHITKTRRTRLQLPLQLLVGARHVKRAEALGSVARAGMRVC